MDMFGHPSTPPFDSRESAAVTAARELANSAPTRANINAYLRMALTMPTLPAGQGGPNGTAFTGRAASAPLNPSQRASRDAILTDLAVQFAGRLASSGRNTDDDAVARDALAAIEDIAVEYALPRVPVVTVLARDALELTRQLRGFLEAQGRAGQAGERFTAAINAFNRSYAARQYFAMRDLAGSEPLVLDPLWLEPGLFEEGPLPGRLGSGGFNGAVFDGRYVYFVGPTVARYDTQGTFSSAAS